MRLSLNIQTVAIQRAGEIADHPVGGDLRAGARSRRRPARSSRRSARLIVRMSASSALSAYSSTKRCCLASGSSGSVARTRSIKSGVDLDRQQVRIREIAVVVRLFLAAHRPRFVLVGIVQTRFLHDLAAVLDHLDLPLDFEVDRLLDEAERIQVLELRARAELLLAARPHRNVGVAAKRTFLHVAVGDLEVAHDASESCACTRPLPWPSAGPARRRSRATACRRDSGRCRSVVRALRASTCRHPPRDARA